MPACVLRVSGPYDHLRNTIRNSPFEFHESIASRRKRERGEASADNRCTFNYTVSDADGDHVPVQVSEAETFLSLHFDRLRILRSADGVDDVCLDFGWNFPDKTSGQFNEFPHSLLQKCAELRIDIQVSVYRVSDIHDDGDT
jgi:hypothetical protein